MEDTFVSRREHEEFAKRIESEDERQNKRISKLEDDVLQINELTLSVSKMATNMEQMVREQKAQGKRLEQLEDVPAKNWSTVKAAILSAIGTAIGAAIIAAIVHFIG